MVVGKVYLNRSRSSGQKRLARRRIGWFGAGRGNHEKDEEQRPFEVDKKEIFSNRSQQTNANAGEKIDKTGGKGQSVRWKAWTEQYQMRSQTRLCFVL